MIDTACMDTTTLKRADGALLRRLAANLRPRPRSRPSAWAEKYARLTEQQGATVIGRYRCDYYPWLKEFHDCLFDRPDKRGVIAPKPSQNGLTTAMMNVMGSFLTSESGNVLYVIGTAESTAEISVDRFKPLLEDCPPLAARFDVGSDDDRRSTVIARPYDGGSVFFTTAGSAPGLSNKSATLVVLDEFDQSERAFPREFGSLLAFAEGRQTAILQGAQLWAFSHPTKKDKGIWRAWEHLSDRGRWVFDCPHCDAPVAPDFEQIHFTRTGQDGKPDPYTAVMRCPHCGETISDAQRRAAVWPVAKGGTGRRESDLPGEIAARRPFIGFAIHGLCNPYRDVSEFAAAIAAAQNDADLQTVYNVKGGQTFEAKLGTMGPEQISKAIQEMERIVVPGGAKGVKFVCSGADVQAPRENPTLYTATLAFAATGHVYVTGLEMVSGFAAWQDLLARTVVNVDDGRGGEGVTRLAVTAAGVDDGYLSGEVKDACRVPTYAAETSARVALVPMRFAARPGLNKDVPWVLRSDDKRVNPARPELGPIDMYDLFRHAWVDRVYQLLAAERLHIVCKPPKDFALHMTAQVLVEKRSNQHWEAEQKEMQWDLAKGRRDDWMMAIAYAICVAVMTRGLDRIHLLGEEATAPAAPAKERYWDRERGQRRERGRFWS